MREDLLRFSNRFDWDQRPNRLTALLRQKRAVGIPILDLTETNPTRVGLEYETKPILDALNDPGSLVYDPQPAGLAACRQAVADYYRERSQLIHPEQILLTASTSEAYSYLFRLLADPGDEVLVPRPSYPLFELLASMDAVHLKYYPLRYTEGWWIDVDALKRSVTPRTRAVLVVSPNNPTGSFVKRDELARLTEICRGNPMALIVDEVFADYSLKYDRESVINDNKLVFLLSGLSKILGLPQMKLAWIAVVGPPRERDLAMDRLNTIADTYLSVSTPIQLAAPRWLKLRKEFQRCLLERLRRNLGLLNETAAGSPCQLLHVEGGWQAILRLPATRSEEDWTLDLLEQDHVLTQPGYFFDFEDEPFAVVSLLPRTEEFAEGIGRILRRARQPRKPSTPLRQP